MRCFIAIDLPKDIKNKIGKLQERIKKSSSVNAKFVNRNSLHVTVKFLGEIKDVDKIRAKCIEIRAKKFKTKLKGVGAFPSEKKVRVLWVGISEGAKDIEKLNQQLCEKLGMKECKPFNSHITIARVKSVKDREKLSELFTSEDFGQFEVSEFKLIKSTLTSSGPVYEVVEEFNLV